MVKKMAIDEGQTESLWKRYLAVSGIDSEQCAFPRAAILAILKGLGVSGESGKRSPPGCVLAGFFYRDTDGDGKFSPGETLPATLLGLPKIEGLGTPPQTDLNCYWFDGLTAGKRRQLSWRPDGIKPVSIQVRIRPGLNILHLPVAPTKPLIYVVPHSHFDPEWAATYEEYLESVGHELDHVRQRLDLQRMEPAHCFANDEECVTRPFMERSSLEYRKRLRQGILEGAIEPKGLITQNELTMPCGESVIRAMTLGERMLSALLGTPVRPEAFWSIDQYGFNYQMPQILKKAGRRYFLIGEYVNDADHARIPYSDPQLVHNSEFWLKGLDGSRVLVHRSAYTSRDLPGPQYLPVLPHQSAFNFHGYDNVGPDADLASRIKSLNAAGGPYKYILALSPSFFHAVERCPDLPEFRAECFVVYWNGIYESNVKLRQHNRMIENKILATEALTTCAWLWQMAYPRGSLDEGWYLLLLNHQHDPQLTVMAKPGLLGEITERYDKADAEVNTALNSTLNWLDGNLCADEQPGVPVMVFNPSAWTRSPVVQAEVTGAFSSARVTDSNGNVTGAQIAGKSDGRTVVAFLADHLPAMGWQTYYISDAPSPDASPQVHACQNKQGYKIENEYLSIQLDAAGRIQEVVEKTSDTVILKADAMAGVNEIGIWKDAGCICMINSTDLAARSSVGIPPSEVKTKLMETGPVRAVIETSFPLGWGRFIQRISLDAGSRTVHFDTCVDWDSAGKLCDFNGRRVRVAFKTAYKGAKVFCDIPFGIIPWQQSGIIRPVQSFLALEDHGTGAAFCHLGPQSLQAVGDTVYMTLFRSVLVPGEDDERWTCGWDHQKCEDREDGCNSFRYAVHIYDGDWKTGTLARAAADFNTPVLVRSVDRHSGRLPGFYSAVSIEPASLVVTSIRPSEYINDNSVILRLYNPTDKVVTGKLHINFDHEGATEVNFREQTVRHLGLQSPYDLHLGAYEITTVRLLYTGSRQGMN